ncbi:hypothetical protein [Lichenihabitans sp. Uapishka_5]|uniref:hypothetical protein n=1 Tax=Lichenihabitans sp. Uapishka_5 TaxID=3037302 RepID=UPI0029E7DF62|nr:hypothetical protein [Lichenihabitans sp. Uapishka_5]
MVISFSNRCFPTKAIALWGRLGGAERMRLVALYLQQAGFPTVEAYDLVSEGSGGDPLHVVIGRTAE